MLREAEVALSTGSTVVEAVRQLGNRLVPCDEGSPLRPPYTGWSKEGASQGGQPRDGRPDPEGRSRYSEVTCPNSLYHLLC